MGQGSLCNQEQVSLEEEEEDYLRVEGSPAPLALTPSTPACVLGQKGRGAKVRLNGWKKEEVVSARLPADSFNGLRGEEEESEPL